MTLSFLSCRLLQGFRNTTVSAKMEFRNECGRKRETFLKYPVLKISWSGCILPTRPQPLICAVVVQDMSEGVGVRKVFEKHLSELQKFSCSKICCPIRCFSQLLLHSVE